jgi:GDPmannose 4,6-dehydratase
MFGASCYVDGFGNKYQDEDTKFLPQSPYAIAKCAAHYMTRLFREAYGLHASAGILFNHEGERRGETFVTRKITKWIGGFYSWFHANKLDYQDLKDCNKTDRIICGDKSYPKLRLGNLDAYRDWGYAGDYVEAMWLMLQQETPDDYVICTGETHTIREFLDVAFSYIGIADWSMFVTIDPEFYRPAEVDYLRGRNWKAVNKLGWKPKHSFKDLVELMVDHDINEDL